MKKTYNVQEMYNTVDLVREVIALYTVEMLSLEKISIIMSITKHAARQILLDNNIQLRKH